MLEKIWGDWEKFASYAFNKSHATCYSWVAYQTAYLKAHYPSEYMAAVMSRNKDNPSEITKLMDECKAMGIPTLGPDVNESRQKFSANAKGEIRFGIGAIKGVGTGAADAIVAERTANGPFKDIFDFIQRVNLTAVNRKSIEVLVLSGGFDSFKAMKREDFFAKNTKGDSFLDTLIRYGQLYKSKIDQMKNSLFGGENAVEIATPPIIKGEEWSDIERLNRERDLVGIYLSAHPLDEYKMILDNLCNTTCDEIKNSDNSEAMKNRESITLGGLVTNVRTGVTKRQKVFGIVTIEDFSGACELALFGNDWADNRGRLDKGHSVYITGKYQPRFRDSDRYELTIQRVEFLQDIKEKAIERFTIMMNTDELNDQIVVELNEILNKSQGHTQLFFQLHDTSSKNNVLLKSNKMSIDVRSELISFIERESSLDYHIN